MSEWVKVTDSKGQPRYVNLATASNILWSEIGKNTTIAWAGCPDEVIRAKEKPEEILAAKRLGAH